MGKNQAEPRVRGKGRRERLIPLIPELQQMLWEYLQTRLPLENRALLLLDFNVEGL